MRIGPHSPQQFHRRPLERRQAASPRPDTVQIRNAHTPGAPAAMGLFGGLFGPPGPVLSEALGTADRLQNQGVEIQRMGKFLWFNTGWKPATKEQIAKLAAKGKKERLRVKQGQDWAPVEGLQDLRRLDGLYGQGVKPTTPEPELTRTLNLLDQNGAEFAGGGAYAVLRSLSQGQITQIDQKLVQSAEDVHLLGYLQGHLEADQLQRPDTGRTLKWIEEHGFEVPQNAYHTNASVPVTLEGVQVANLELEETAQVQASLSTELERYQELQKNLADKAPKAWSILHSHPSERHYPERARALETIFKSGHQKPDELYATVLQTAQEKGSLDALAGQAAALLGSEKAGQLWQEVATEEGVNAGAFLTALHFEETPAVYRQVEQAGLSPAELVSLEKIVGGGESHFSGWSHQGETWTHSYRNREDTSLTSRALSLPEGSTLRFHLSGDTEPQHDYLTVEMKRGGQWEELKRFSGPQNGTQELKLQGNLQVRFRFRSDRDTTRSGFRLSEIRLQDPNGSTLAHGNPPVESEMLTSWLRPAEDRAQRLLQMGQLVEGFGNPHAATRAQELLGVKTAPERTEVLSRLAQEMGAEAGFELFKILQEKGLDGSLEAARMLPDLAGEELPKTLEQVNNLAELELLHEAHGKLGKLSQAQQVVDQLKGHRQERDFPQRRAALMGLAHKFGVQSALGVWPLVGNPEIYSDPRAMKATEKFLGGLNSVEWTGDRGWGLADSPHGRVWADSPGGRYGDNADTSLTSGPISLAGIEKPFIEFQAAHEVENSHDHIFVQVKGRNGQWNSLAQLDGRGEWKTHRFSLEEYKDQEVQVRFRLTSDRSQTYDGLQLGPVVVGRSEMRPGGFDLESIFSCPAKDRSLHLKKVLRFAELTQSMISTQKLWPKLVPHLQDPDIDRRMDVLARVAQECGPQAGPAVWQTLEKGLYQEDGSVDRVLGLLSQARENQQGEEMLAELPKVTGKPELALFERLNLEFSEVAAAGNLFSALAPHLQDQDFERRYNARLELENKYGAEVAQAVWPRFSDPAIYGSDRAMAAVDSLLDRPSHGWTGDKSWGIEQSPRGPVWSDSPGGRYRDDTETSLVSEPIDLRGAQGTQILFSARHELEDSHDKIYLEARGEKGDWVEVQRLEGRSDWKEHRVDLSAYDGQQTQLRFRLRSDGSQSYDGILLGPLVVRDQQQVFSEMQPGGFDYQKLTELPPGRTPEQNAEDLVRLARFAKLSGGLMTTQALWPQLAPHTLEPDFETRLEALARVGSRLGADAGGRLWKHLEEDLFKDSDFTDRVTAMVYEAQQTEQHEVLLTRLEALDKKNPRATQQLDLLERLQGSIDDLKVVDRMFLELAPHVADSDFESRRETLLDLTQKYGLETAEKLWPRVAVPDIYNDPSARQVVDQVMSRVHQAGWEPGHWGQEEIGGQQVWSDSPGGRYRADVDSAFTSKTFSLAGVQNPTLEFRARHELERTHDKVKVEVSTAGGEWKSLELYTGNADWKTYRLALEPDHTRLRFRLVSDGSQEHDGMQISEIRIFGTEAGGKHRVVMSDAPEDGSLAELFQASEGGASELRRLAQLVGEVGDVRAANELWRVLSPLKGEDDFELRAEALTRMAQAMGGRTAVEVWPALAGGLYADPQAVTELTRLALAAEANRLLDDETRPEELIAQLKTRDDLRETARLMEELGSPTAAHRAWPALKPHVGSPDFEQRSQSLVHFISEYGLESAVGIWPVLAEGELWKDPKVHEPLKKLLAPPSEPWEARGWAPSKLNGRKVWSESPGRRYSDNANSTLTSPPLRIEDRTAQLSFSAWVQTEATHDKFQVEVIDSKGQESVLETFSGGLGQMTQTYSLADFMGQEVRLRFHFTSDSSQTDEGVALADIKVGDQERVLLLGDPESPEVDLGAQLKAVEPPQRGRALTLLADLSHRMGGLAPAATLWSVLAQEVDDPDFEILSGCAHKLANFVPADQLKAVWNHLSEGRSGDRLQKAVDDLYAQLLLHGNIDEALESLTLDVDIEIGEDYVGVGDFDIARSE